MIQVELGPELEKAVRASAEALQVSVEEYARNIFSRTLIAEAGRRTPEDLEDTLAALARFGDGIPQLPDYAFTRESFYEDDRIGREF